MDGTEKKTRLATPIGQGGSQQLAAASAPPAQTPAPANPVAAAAPAAAARTPLPSNVPAAGVVPAAVVPADPYVGTILNDRFRVIKKLGEGGMGAVYLAEHITLEKTVALKMLHQEFSRKEDLVQRFLQEAKSASRIRHENVIDISDFGQTPDGSVFFAMEYLEGRDLHDLLARTKLEGHRLQWDRSSKIFLQVCSALTAAHAKGIIHRDLKPENIYLVEWLGHKDFVKLLDFGIAKVTEVTGEEERKLTKTGMLFGTPEYMSPEQARGDKVDARVDVYAMGCILFQLVTGHVPFEADNFMGILSQHLTEEPPVVTPEQLAAVGAPPELGGIVAGALIKDPAERYQSIADLAQAVRALSGEAEPVPVPVASQRTRTRWTGSVELHDDAPAATGGGRKTGLIIGGLVVLGAAAAAVFMLTRGGDAKPTDVPPSQSAVTNESAASLPKLPAIVVLTLNSTPEGAVVVDTANGKELGKTPLSFDMPGARDPRRFQFKLANHQDKLLELIPAENIDYTVTLTKLAAGQTVVAAPEVVVMPQAKIRRRRPRTRPSAKPATAVKPTPVATKPKPTVTKPTVAKPTVAKPTVAKPKPTVTKPKPTVTKPKPTVTKPTVTKPKPTTIEPKPTVVKPNPGDPVLKDPFSTK